MSESTVRAYLAEHRAAWLDELMEWLAIPSISADPTKAADVTASAEWLAAAFARRGANAVELLATPGAPAVYAEFRSADAAAPTVLVYGHHDVQPVDPVEAWGSPPFQPTIVGDEVRARGAIDDKGQLAFHLLGLPAHLAATGSQAPAVTLKFLVEGAEEIGSPHFRDLLEQHRERLTCDVIVVSDTTMFRRDVPSVCVSMRGMQICEVTARGAAEDLHSGVFGGGVPNPLHAMAEFIAGLHDAQGRVAIAGFYDEVRDLDPEARAKLAALPFDEQAWLAGTAQARAPYGEAGYSTLERIGVRPTVECNGMWGGHIGAGAKTVIPTSANAKLSFRLVADQDPATIRELFREHLAQFRYPGIEFTVEFGGAVRPVSTPIDAPANQALLRAMGRAFEREILVTHEGGSGPQADLVDVLDAPLVFLGVGLPDDRFHAPNERASIAMLLKGAEAAAYLWEELAALSR